MQGRLRVHNYFNIYFFSLNTNNSLTQAPRKRETVTNIILNLHYNTGGSRLDGCTP